MRRCMAWLAVIAIAMAAFGPTLAAARAHAAGVATVFLCTGSGMRTVMVDAQGEPLAVAPVDGTATHCPLCGPPGGVSAPPAVTGGSAWLRTDLSLAVPAGQVAPAPRDPALGIAQPRGPPARRA